MSATTLRLQVRLPGGRLPAEDLFARQFWYWLAKTSVALLKVACQMAQSLR